LIENRGHPKEHVQKESNDELKIHEIDIDDRYSEGNSNRHDELDEE
jgi:hypothetical protein